MAHADTTRERTAPLRVLHIITVLSVGGAEVWLIQLLRHIRETGADVEFDILMTGGAPNELDDLAVSLGAKLHYIRFSRRDWLSFISRFRKLLADRSYSAIHDHQDYASGWHFLAGARLLPPVRIVHVHNPLARLRGSRNTRVRERLFTVSRTLVKRFATHILGTSRQILAEYEFDNRKFPRQAINALHCGFDPAPFRMSHVEAKKAICAEHGWDPDVRIALFVGRLNGLDRGNPAWNHKNPRFALEVAREAMRTDTALRFVMVGGGEPVESQLRREVEDWGLSSRIHLAGSRMDVPRYMAAADCLLVPSLEEGLGMVAVEGQAAGLRVLASDAVPREAAICDELISFLPLEAGVAAWSRELKRSLELPRLEATNANDAVERSDFSIGNSFARLERIYRGAAE